MSAALVLECSLGYHDACESQDATTYCECACHDEESSAMPMTPAEAIFAGLLPMPDCQTYSQAGRRDVAVLEVLVPTPIDATLLEDDFDGVRCADHARGHDGFWPISDEDLARYLPAWQAMGWGACDVCSGRAPW